MLAPAITNDCRLFTTFGLFASLRSLKGRLSTIVFSRDETAADVVKALPEKCNKIITNDSQARALVKGNGVEMDGTCEPWFASTLNRFRVEVSPGVIYRTQNHGFRFTLSHVWCSGRIH